MKKMPPSLSPRSLGTGKILKGKDEEDARQSTGYKMLPVEDGSQLVTICHQLKIENEIIHNDDDGQLLNITYKFD
jgi:hypothetical protein